MLSTKREHGQKINAYGEDSRVNPETQADPSATAGGSLQVHSDSQLEAHLLTFFQYLFLQGTQH
ncbi:hypothetical protein T11_13005 [Trichinella zimbabwensis]|uniref:Uncharacterized protein n=1 Tax=Trichinella zimbabwensis TaxID=268475 RepID=A0A0V1HDK9_9BILA|nr:hypothetical protein T11_13005 [Trichinella zimbabwensis]